MAATVWVEDAGRTRSKGRSSTYQQVWFSKGDSSNANVRTAIEGHSSYLASVATSDGYTLDVIDWDYSILPKSKKRIVLTYSHAESRRNKTQNKPLQVVGDEETRIFRGEIMVPVMESMYFNQDAIGNSPDVGNRIEYNPQTREVRGTKKKKLFSRIEISKIYDQETVTNDWEVFRESKMFTLNQSTFRGRAPETVMFTGFEQTQRAKEGDWHVKFSFIHMPMEEMDLTTLDIGSSDTGYAIFPWRFYWSSYEEEEDTTAKVLVPKCKGFYQAYLYPLTPDFEEIIA